MHHNGTHVVMVSLVEGGWIVSWMANINVSGRGESPFAAVVQCMENYVKEKT